MGELPETMRQAVITLIPKQGKDPVECGSYRPISLLNMDVKILARLLVRRWRIVSRGWLQKIKQAL